MALLAVLRLIDNTQSRSAAVAVHELSGALSKDGLRLRQRRVHAWIHSVNAGQLACGSRGFVVLRAVAVFTVGKSLARDDWFGSVPLPHLLTQKNSRTSRW